MRTSLELFASIPRTRATITHHSHGRPIYEDTNPYLDKLPAELLSKAFYDITPDETLAHALAADKPDHTLDTMIWYKFILDPAIGRGDHLTIMGSRTPPYTGSLDAAIKLYDARPPMIPSDPLDVVCDALRIKLLHG